MGMEIGLEKPGASSEENVDGMRVTVDPWRPDWWPAAEAEV
jgi:hypothetical protein